MHVKYIKLIFINRISKSDIFNPFRHIILFYNDFKKRLVIIKEINFLIWNYKSIALMSLEDNFF